MERPSDPKTVLNEFMNDIYISFLFSLLYCYCYYLTWRRCRDCEYFRGSFCNAATVENSVRVSSQLALLWKHRHATIVVLKAIQKREVELTRLRGHVEVRNECLI